MQETSPPIPKQPIGTTFVVSMAVLGAFAIVQILAVMLRFAPELSRAAQAAGLEDARRAQGIEQLATPSAGRPETSNQPLQNQMRAQELVDQARESLAAGNQTAALEYLAQANQVFPENAEIMVGLARLQTSLQQPQAADTWQRILDLGPQAAQYRAEAESQLDLIGPANGSGLPTTPETDTQVALRDADGLQPGSTLGIVDVREVEQGTGFKTLNVAIKSRPQEPIDVQNVKIHVYFYEDVDGSIEQTRSKILYDWISQPADWAAPESMELLQVKYRVPNPGEVAEDGTSRQYYGYMVHVYYEGSLQDFRAVPVDLRENFPPPFDLNE